MTFLEIYRTRKENLALRIKESKSLYETSGVISEALETMQYQYLSQDGNEDLDEKLADLVGMAKESVSVIESVNKSKLWEKAEDGEPKKKSPLPGLLLMLAGWLLVFGSVWYYMFLHNIKMAEMKSYFAAMGVGCLVIVIAGFALFFRKKPKNKAVVEIMVDAEDIVNRFEKVISEIDKILDNEKKAISQNKIIMETAIKDDEVQLFSYLLEAKYSAQPDFAMEQLSEVEHYLAKQDVIIVPYSKGNEKYFEFLEGNEDKTIRPALLRNGETLAKGLVELKDLNSIV